MASISILLLVLVTRLASHVFAAAALPTHGAGLGNITWRGNITEDGPILELTGTSLHDIERQIGTTIAGFTWNTTWTSQSLNETDNIGMLKSMGSPQCGVIDGHRPCSFGAINAGYLYLKSIQGSCHVAGKMCTRLSCSYNSGIYYCNDGEGDLWIPCSTLGLYALYINQECYFELGMEQFGSAGQLFNTDGWNVFIGATTAKEGGC